MIILSPGREPADWQHGHRDRAKLLLTNHNWSNNGKSPRPGLRKRNLRDPVIGVAIFFHRLGLSFGREVRTACTIDFVIPGRRIIDGRLKGCRLRFESQQPAGKKLCGKNCLLSKAFSRDLLEGWGLHTSHRIRPRVDQKRQPASL